MQRLVFVFLVAALLCAGTLTAQEVGTVAEVQGQAELVRAGARTAVSIGMAVRAEDELQTSRPGRLRVVFQDDSVLTIGDDSQVRIDEHIVDIERGVFRSIVRLVKGRVRAVVSDYYGRRGAVYEIDTVTAVAGVRGTEFVAVFDPVAEVTEVVGVSGGRVAVHSVIDRTARGVFVTARELTQVARGKLPTRPQPLDEITFRQYIEGLEFIGDGRPESLIVQNPLLSGADIPPEDRAAALPAPVGEVGGPLAHEPRTRAQKAIEDFDTHDASTIIGESPMVLEAIPGQVGIDF